MVFFAYIGFDAVSTAAQEAKNPKRDMPIGILGSLAVCTVLYIAVSTILTGVVPYTELSVPHPIAVGIQRTGISWLETAVEIGAIAGLSSVMLVMLLGQPRIFYSMARDGLFPPIAERVRRGELGYREAVVRGLYRPLGAGDARIGRVLAQLEGRSYRGWYVLEQDVVLAQEPRTGEGPMTAARQSLDYFHRTMDECRPSTS